MSTIDDIRGLKVNSHFTQEWSVMELLHSPNIQEYYLWIYVLNVKINLSTTSNVFIEKNYVQLLFQSRTQHHSLSSQINREHAYPAQSLKIHFNNILLNLSLPNGHFPSGFSTRILCAPLLSSPTPPCAISFFTIWYPENYFGMVIHHKAAHYKIFVQE